MAHRTAMASDETWVSGLDYAGPVRAHDLRALAHQLIKPALSPTSDQYQPASLDLSVGAIVTPRTIITPQSKEQEYRLRPGGLVTVLTLEELHLPLDFIGAAYAINAISQKGLLVLNPGHIDPGYRGVLAIKLLNLQRADYIVRLKDLIFTVVFYKLAKPAECWRGPYLNLEKRILKMREAIEGSAAAALLDIHGNGIADLIEETVHSRFLFFQDSTVKLARKYDDAQRTEIMVEFQKLYDKLSQVEDRAIQEEELGQVIWKQLKGWIVALIGLGAALAQIFQILMEAWRK